MKKTLGHIVIVVLLMMISLQQQAQVLDVSVINVGSNKIQIVGVPTAPGFTAVPANAWATMNLTWRIPKTAAIPPPTVAPPNATPQVIDEATEFTGTEPRNTFNDQMDLSIFDLTHFGLADDGYWYFQVTGTQENVQNMTAGNTYILYEFTTPWQWLCTACVELLLSDNPDLPISTTSYIDNGGLGIDVLRLVQNNAPLPVIFQSFEARKDQQQVQLTWRVSNEENISAYHVERSADGINYTTIGSVDPKPVAATNEYAFTDVAPLSPVNYYRIREEDRDGRAVYSIVRIVRMEGTSFIVSLYPVPVKDELTLKLTNSANEPAYIRITDVLGRTILRRKVQLNAGENIQKISVHEWKNGMYFIDVTGTGKQWAGKFVKE